MPRKKKKSILERKPSLVFTESPVHIQKNVPSPVFCARHPPTASSVPVEQLQRLLWVSPQFRNIHSASKFDGKHRTTRQRRHSTVGYGHTSNKENTNTHNGGTNKKLNRFQSLKFLGDHTTYASIAEDVEVTIDSDTAEEEDNQVDEIAETSSPCEGCSRERQSRNGSKQSLNNIRPTSGISSPLLNGGKVEDRCRGPPSHELNTTKTRHFTKDKPPIKRLFASQLGCKKTFENCPDDTEHALDDEERGASGAVERLSEQTVCQQVNHFSETEGESSSSPNIRRSKRIQCLRQMFASSQSPRAARQNNKHILAPDTPENEYGWSKRKRQLIAYLKKKQ